MDSSVCPLIKAVKNNDVDETAKLLKNGGNPNYEDPHERKTPLLYATWHNNLEIVKLLVKYGADVNFQNVIGHTPLIYAAQEGSLEMVQYNQRHTKSRWWRDRTRF